jgi:hypothetical protein
MTDLEIRMWAVQQVMNDCHDADQAIAEAQRLYLFVTGKVTPIVGIDPIAQIEQSFAHI